jgi:polyphosphate glucokinase
MFERILGQRPSVLNDAAGLAEVVFGAGSATDGTVLVITLGTGIGSALVFNGQLIPNTELGHLELDGRDAETKASTIARERAQLSWEDYRNVLGRYLSHLEFLLSPDLFILGGGISVRAAEFLPVLTLGTPIVPARLHNNAGIVGAAHHAAGSAGHPVPVTASSSIPAINRKAMRPA